MTLESGTASTTLDGIAAILRAVAWPIIVLLFLFLYRMKLAVLIDLLTHKVKDAKH